MKKDKEWLKEAIGELNLVVTEFEADGMCYMDRAVSVTQVHDLVDQLDESGKVVVPKFVADWIEHCKGNDLDLYEAFGHSDMSVEASDLVGDMDADILARAWLDGYEVVEEQKYYAKIKGWELFVDFVGAKYWGEVSNYGRLGFVSIDGAKDRTKDEWNELGINDLNADFVKVEVAE